MVTDREAEVLLWIARGKSNRDIAEILSLSPRTVNKHLEQIYTKLGVENRTSAAALAVRTLGIRWRREQWSTGSIRSIARVTEPSHNL
jgi:DNA-binding CsgD family transcriptional regulator